LSFFSFCTYCPGDVVDDDDVVDSALPQIQQRTSASDNIEAKVSETASIDCGHVTGSPRPSVDWLVNGQPLDRRHTDQRYHLSPDGATLNVSDLQVSDTGRYTCVAKNSVGVAERDFNLDVLGTFW